MIADMPQLKKEFTISASFISGMKEALRTAVFALIPNMIVALETKEINVYLLLSSFIIAFLSGVSEWLHKTGKAEEELTGEKSIFTTGLSGF